MPINLGPIEPGRLLMLALLLPFAASCTTSSSTRFGADAEGWGEANRQTMAAQIIDPAPSYDRAVPETSGDHAAAAIERYRTDKVKKPERQQTSNISIGGSN